MQASACDAEPISRADLLRLVGLVPFLCRLLTYYCIHEISIYYLLVLRVITGVAINTQQFLSPITLVE